MPGGNKNIKPSDGKQFSSTYQPDKEIWTEKMALSFANDMYDWLKEKEENIFYDEFLLLIADPKKYHKKAKIYSGLPSYLSEKFSSCSNLFEKCMKIQELKLVKYGCLDKLNASMTKFTLINNHDWRDKQEHDLTTKGESMNAKPDLSKLTDKELDALEGLHRKIQP